jgi:hypothetical protein
MVCSGRRVLGCLHNQEDLQSAENDDLGNRTNVPQREQRPRKFVLQRSLFLVLLMNNNSQHELSELFLCLALLSLVKRAASLARP